MRETQTVDHKSPSSESITCVANGGLFLEARMLAARFVVSGFGCLFLLGGVSLSGNMFVCFGCLFGFFVWASWFVGARNAGGFGFIFAVRGDSNLHVGHLWLAFACVLIACLGRVGPNLASVIAALRRTCVLEMFGAFPRCW